MGGSNRLFGVIVVVGLWLIASPSQAKTDYHSGIWNLLRAAHFWFSENGDSRAWRVGIISSGGHQYEIWGYAWEETPQTKAASTEHAAYHLLVFERREKSLIFVGDYTVDGFPFKVSGRTIKFDYGKQRVGEGYPPARKGDEIVFDDNGPPSVILLDGEFHWLDPAAHHVGVWRAMELGQFSGATDIDARIWPAGSIKAGKMQFQIWGYAWKQKPWFKDEPYKQERYKVLVLEQEGKNLSYLGSYERDNVAFRVKGRTVKFDLPKSGRPPGYLRDDPGEGIVFDDNGPPAEARINWVMRPFVK